MAKKVTAPKKVAQPKVVKPKAAPTDNHTTTDKVKTPTDDVEPPAVPGELVGNSASLVAGQPDETAGVINHTLTDQDLHDNPEMAVQGLSVGDEVEIMLKADVPENLKAYLAAYPQEKAFYCTSDGQVFLEGNKHLAREHQTQLDKNKELTVFKVGKPL